MKTVLLRAPLLSHSGYGVHARQVARWLFRTMAETHQLDITTEILNWGNTHWITDVTAEDGLVGEILQASTNVKPFYDLTLQLQLPNEWNPNLGRVNVGITAGVETDKCNPAWINAVNSMNMVVVPSEFTKNTFLNSGEVQTPINVVAEAFPDELLEPAPLLPLELPTPFNFLVFGQLTGNNVENDRKNIPFTMKWLAEAFAGRSDVGVVLKTNMGALTHLDKTMVTNVMNQLLAQIQVSPLGPKFYLLHGDMTTSELRGLYTHPNIKAMVTLTRGEGWGLPILEAAACDLPVIATGWSAHTEFLGLGKYIKIENTLTTIHPSRVDQNIFMQDAKWAAPSELDAKQRLLKFYNSPQLPKEWAVDLGKIIREKYNFEAIAQQYTKTLGSLLE